jgi:hypothetical protein
MADEYQHEEMSSAVGLGLLASDMVLATGKLLRAGDLSEHELQTLRHGWRLLEVLSAPLEDIPPSEGLSQLGTKSSALDALQAVQVRVPGQDVQSYVQPLSEGLKAVLAGESPDAHQNELTLVQDLFASIGDVELTRVSNLSRPTPDVPPWLTSTATSRS